MRGVRVWLVLGAIAIGATARAGVPVIVDPFDTASCGETDYVATLDDPNGVYSALIDCPGLCRLTEFECRKLTKLTFSCQNLIVSKRQTWSRANCAATITDDKAALRACNLDAKNQAALDKMAVRNAQADALDACAAWSATCQTTCGP